MPLAQAAHLEIFVSLEKVWGMKQIIARPAAALLHTGMHLSMPAAQLGRGFFAANKQTIRSIAAPKSA